MKAHLCPQSLSPSNRLSWCSWKLSSLAYFFSTPAPLCLCWLLSLTGPSLFSIPHGLPWDSWLWTWPHIFYTDFVLGFCPYFFKFQIQGAALYFYVGPNSTCQSFLTHGSKTASPKQNKTTPCIHFHHLFRNRVSLLQKISSQNLLACFQFHLVSSVMVPAVSLDSLGPGLRQKLGGMDQESASGRVRGTKANTYSRCWSGSSVLAIWGIACERAWVCECVPWQGSTMEGKGLSATKSWLGWLYLTIELYPPQLNLTNLWKVTLKELLALCLNASKPMGSWKADTSSSGCTEVNCYWKWANKMVLKPHHFYQKNLVWSGNKIAFSISINIDKNNLIQLLLLLHMPLLFKW